MTKLPAIPVVILASGQARRFGSPKGLALIDGVPIVQLIASKMSEQTRGPILINSDKDSEYAALGLGVLPDLTPGGLGPLAGLHTAIAWALENNFSQIVTVPVDTPFLPDNLVERLVDHGAPAIAESCDQQHPICGIWSAKQIDEIETALQGGERRAMRWASACNAAIVHFECTYETDVFFNVNTPEDLALAQRRAVQMHRK